MNRLGYRPQRTKVSDQLTMTRYERTSSLLVSLVVCLTVACTVLFMIWLSGRENFATRISTVNWTPLEEGKAAPEGIAAEFQEPGIQDFPDIPEPQLAAAIEPLSLKVSVVRAHREAIDAEQRLNGLGRSLGTIDSTGDSIGNTTKDRPWDRWQIRYSSASRNEYARQLDQFGISLGALDLDSPRIDYVFDLSETTPGRRVGTKSNEPRIFFNFRDGSLQDWDRSFFEQAGIDLERSILVQFYPTTTTNQLRRLEREYIGGDVPIDSIRRTIFGVRMTDQAFEYYVIDVIYHTL